MDTFVRTESRQGVSKISRVGPIQTDGEGHFFQRGRCMRGADGPSVRFRPIAVTRTKSKLFDNQKWGSALMVFAKSLFCGFWVTIRNIANPSQEKMNVIMNQPNVAPP